MKKLIGQELGLCVEGSRWLAESLESAVGHRELLWFAPLEETDRRGQGDHLGGNRYLVHVTRKESQLGQWRGNGEEE